MHSVLNYLARHQARFVEELCDYVRFRSVSAQPQHAGDMKACAAWLVRHCRSIGLTAEVRQTPGHPIVIAKTPRLPTRRKRRHFLIYGHYDVQPPEPFELWKTPPFQPTRRGASLFGRGASDNKGQNFAHLKAIEAYLRTQTELPCDLTCIIEGEEEVGSSSLAGFLQQHRAELKCDAVIVSDTGIPGPKYPALTCSLRGIAAFELTLHGPSRDLHSGMFGGSVENPAMALCRLLGKVHDDKGRIRIPHFHDGIARLTKYERRQLARVPFNRRAYRKFLGVPQLHGEAGFTPEEQRSARPTFEINGLTSGYQGAGSKTIVPAWARAKITTRLVPGQQPRQVVRAVKAFLKKHCPGTVRMELKAGHGAEAYAVSPTSAAAQAALRALREAFGHEPVLLREGGSIPIVNQFKKILGADTLLLGLALPDDNAHSPNEKFDLGIFAKGQRLSALLWRELAK
ncbi:MAG TPA: dipeptidase [Verrucomicrobiota bacterium]|nr:dipeptidase [Verrucomicrobiota bacterium]HNT14213.1 dipeptidase [Verrucomicrobiota bacterium]